MARAARISEQGGPEVIQWVDQDLAPPPPGQVRMRNTAIGLNYIDTYHRDGTYPIPLPNGLGIEAAGVVEAVGDGVSDFVAGDRVCTFGPVLGAYATERNLPAAALFPIPDDISDDVAAAGLLRLHHRVSCRALCPGASAMACAGPCSGRRRWPVARPV